MPDKTEITLPAIKTVEGVLPTFIGAESGKYLYGFDPARGDDCAVRSTINKETMMLEKVEYFNKRTGCWE